MKIIPLGVNSAFAVGKYEDCVTLKDLDTILLQNPTQEEFSVLLTQFTKQMYDPKWQSNFLIEFDMPGKVRPDIYRLVVDFGGDIRHSLARIGLKIGDIDGWYLSHPHNDHMGGIEGIALSTFFNPFWNSIKKEWHTVEGNIKRIDHVLETKGLESLPDSAKPDLYGDSTVIDELWRSAEPGLMTLEGIRKVHLESYFNVVKMYPNKTELKFKDGKNDWNIFTVVSTHVVAGAGMMPSFGLFFEGSHGSKIYMPTDCQLMSPNQIRAWYNRADVIYQDCETGPASGVHPHITDLRKLDSDLKQKLYLYHYNEMPEVDEGEFKSILKLGDVHEY